MSGSFSSKDSEQTARENPLGQAVDKVDLVRLWAK